MTALTTILILLAAALGFLSLGLALCGMDDPQTRRPRNPHRPPPLERYYTP